MGDLVQVGSSHPNRPPTIGCVGVAVCRRRDQCRLDSGWSVLPTLLGGTGGRARGVGRQTGTHGNGHGTTAGGVRAKSDWCAPGSSAGVIAMDADELHEQEEHRTTSGLERVRPGGGPPRESREGSLRGRVVTVAGLAGIAVSSVVGFTVERPAGLVVTVFGLGLTGLALGLWASLWDDRTKRQLVVGEMAADVGIALMTGAVVGLVLLAVQADDEEDRFERETRRDNVRFVREVAMQPDPTVKPFYALDLQDAQLGGLDLSGAEFAGADLSSATLIDTDLTDANLVRVDLRDAVLVDSTLVGSNLDFADLSNTRLEGVDLTDASFTGTDLSGADLTGAEIPEDVNLASVVHDEDTLWPDGVTPP